MKKAIKYASKSFEVDAIQFVGTNIKQCREFAGGCTVTSLGLMVDTVAGRKLAMKTDWLTKRGCELFAPVQNDSFRSRFQAASIAPQNDVDDHGHTGPCGTDQPIKDATGTDKLRRRQRKKSA